MNAPLLERALADHESRTGRRHWHLVLADQLSDELGPAATTAPEALGLVVLEDRRALRRRPYHRQRLALILSNLRQFAVEQVRRGVAVRWVATEAPVVEALDPILRELGGATVMRPAQREDRRALAPLMADGLLTEVAHSGWLSTSDDFQRNQSGRAGWKMDPFYRHMRRRTGLLMTDDGPEGGSWSFDADNRKPWRGEPTPPEPPTFQPDHITAEAVDFVDEAFSSHPGAVGVASLPATRQDAELLWAWALRECMPCFGPYEDAMTTRSSGLFHTRISGLVNLHRLLPGRVVADVAAADAPIGSREGFVRQILGWREYVRHVHEATDGFRTLPDASIRVRESAGDGGWSHWSGGDWLDPDSGVGEFGGACPNHLGANGALPPAYWGEASGLACLDQVVSDVWREGWSHHITRLMVLGNLATLLGVEPRQLTDWFWAAYVDSWDWVVEPNVLGMASYATGPLMTTKPYVSGAAYINRMSDFCSGCRFDPKSDCPITAMYWAFLDRHRERLADNPRMGVVLNALAKRGDDRRRDDRRTAEHVRGNLAAGNTLHP